jgi:hypothetical protein
MLEWNPDKFLNEAKEIHPDLEYYIRQVLLNKQHPEQAYGSCQGILSFVKRIGKERLIHACKRAHEVGWYNYRTIENILKKGLDRELADEAKLNMPAHENIRGNEYYS